MKDRETIVRVEYKDHMENEIKAIHIILQNRTFAEALGMIEIVKANIIDAMRECGENDE